MEKILAYLESNRARFIEELCDYVKFPSVSAQPAHKADMIRAAEWLVARAQAAGLQARLEPTPGNPVVMATTGRRAGRPHYVVYGHYDVQPPEPFDLWKTPPFEPTLRDGKIFARGVSDNKGQHLAHLFAVEAYLKTGTELPCDITFLVEGEEEVGSANLAAFLKAHRKELACEAFVISDTGMPSLKQPALTYALRGLTAFEIKVTGPNRDLHSGIFGGSLENPAMALAQILAQLRDKKGRVAIPGFYDDVKPLTKLERAEMARLPYHEAQFKKFLGVSELTGEAGYTANERRSARPTLEINGLTSGYQGAGSKTIVPSWASAKITCRLVPGQSPAKVFKLAAAHLKKICPPTVKLQVEQGHGGDPYIVDPTSPIAKAGLRALEKAFRAKPLLLREGGSIPILNDIKKIVGVDTLLLGLALPEDNAHSPNEKFDLKSFTGGMEMAAYLWEELRSIGKK
jgi:acetylornithine deacetylase/succinyl-diaminopimelate desuccinylase-like protein